MYGRACAAWPARFDLKIQFGNCSKEATRYGDAFQAFIACLVGDEAAEAELQLGHLFKVTGNFAAARVAFWRAAKLGSQNALSDFDSFAPHWLGVARFKPVASAAGSHHTTIEALNRVLALDLSEDVQSKKLHEAASALRISGQRDLARAYHELAFLCADFSSRHTDQISVVARTGLWPPAHFERIARGAGGSRLHARKDSRGRLAWLIARVLESGRAPASAPEATISDWPPVLLAGAEMETHLTRMVEALSRAYECMAQGGPTQGEDLIAAMAQLRAAVPAQPDYVFFDDERTAASLRGHATRVLQSCVRRWLTQVEGRYRGPHATPELIASYHALGVDPVVERLRELGSAAAVIEEAGTISAVLDSHSRPIDDVLAVLLRLSACELSLAESRAFLEEALKRKMFEVCKLVVEREVASPFLADADIGRIAQSIKQVGGPELAFELLNRLVSNNATSSPLLIEKALIAKTCGYFAVAGDIFLRCAAERPDDEFVRNELATIMLELEPVDAILDRFQHDALFMSIARNRLAYRLRLEGHGADDDYHAPAEIDEGVRVHDLVPQIATEFASHAVFSEVEAIEIIGAGWSTQRGPGLYETRRKLRRCDFVRVKVASREEMVRVRVRIDGRTVGSAKGVRLITGFEQARLRHAMFNCWLDLSGIAPGYHEMQIFCEEIGSGYRSREELIWVDHEQPTADEMRSAATVVLPAGGVDSVDAYIAAQPSEVFPAARRLLEPPRQVLLIRADQLGDVVVSIPAMLRVRELFPQAEISCLVSPRNVDMVTDLGLFSEIFTVDFTYDEALRRRTMGLVEQARLRRALGAKAFDLAIDLSTGGESRPLLQLSRARFTAGFQPGAFPWLDYGMEVRTRDPVTGREMMPPALTIRMMVEGLGALAHHQAVVRLRHDVDWSVIRRFGVKENEPFAVLHSGARTLSRKWPLSRYVELARLLTTQAQMRVILLADHPNEFARCDLDDLPAERFHAVELQPSFAELDGLLSLCVAFVGNDSGPKHLAALRGAAVTSIHMGAVNWSEWGQDGAGQIVLRRVPCFGCGIEQVEECGKGLPCLMDIRPAEVYAAVIASIESSDRYAMLKQLSSH